MDDIKIFYNYGQFNYLEKKDITEKEFFLDKLDAYRILCDSRQILKVDGEQNLNILIKLKIRESSKSLINDAMKSFLKRWGISYEYIDNNEKQKLLKSDFTLESIKSFAKNYHSKYIEECKKNLPLEIHICFKDICFIYYNHLFGYPKTTINNFIYNIRDYFILERYKIVFDEFRDHEIFNEIKEKMTNIYPVLKEKYVNKYFDKFLSFIFSNNDYNNEKIKTILDNYSNLKENKYIKLKEKEE